MDYLIRDGYIIDGSGGDPVETNIGIKGDRIAFIGRAEVRAEEVIDARGLIVSPGFIDTHAHSEFTILVDGRCEGKLSQGVTTEINGNCGLSAAPLYGEALEEREADFKELGIRERWSTLGEYLSLLENKGIAINFATLCGHGNIRASVIGYKNRPSDKEDILEMKRLFYEALREGARGFSTGLVYPPGVYADIEELIELCSKLQTPNSELIYVSHIRSEGDGLIEAIEEAIRVGRETGADVHISHIKTSGEHNWWKIDKAIELMEGARADGIALTCDRYPYVAASTDLDVVLPPWIYEGVPPASPPPGTSGGRVREGVVRCLKDPEIRAKVKGELSSKLVPVSFKQGAMDYWKGVYISSVTKDENRWMEGKDIFGISQRMGKLPQDAVLDILIDEGLRVGAIFFSMNKENLERFLSLPYLMIGSDSSARSFSGPTRKGKPHPRGFGTFPRFIGRYVRDKAILTLPEAIRRITQLPASTFGLRDRGLIKEGFYADIVIFNHDRVIDRATFNDPYQMADGIEYVFVNGRLTFKEGEYAGSLAGRVLR